MRMPVCHVWMGRVVMIETSSSSIGEGFKGDTWGPQDGWAPGDHEL